MSEAYVNGMGWTFRDGFAIPPAELSPSHVAHRFDPATDEPSHVRDTEPTHAPYAHVMDTLIQPPAGFAYQPGMFVYVHDHAYETNPLAAYECCIDDVSGAPLEIVVHPCNHPEKAFRVPQDRLSAPIWV